jgi:hypothetical protein
MTDTDNTNHKDKINKSNLFQDDTTNGEFILTDDLFIKVKDEIRDDIDLEIDNSLLQQILLENGLLGKIDKETLKRILIERGDAIKKRSLKERDEKIANDNKAIIKASIFNRLNLFEEKKRALGNANKNVIKLNIENKKIGSQTPEEKESKNVDEKVEENIDSTNKNISISKMKDLSTLKAPGNIGLNTKNRADGSILWQGSIEWGEMLITGVITKMGSEINISISFSNSSKKKCYF